MLSHVDHVEICKFSREARHETCFLVANRSFKWLHRLTAQPPACSVRQPIQHTAEIAASSSSTSQRSAAPRSKRYSKAAAIDLWSIRHPDGSNRWIRSTAVAARLFVCMQSARYPPSARPWPTCQKCERVSHRPTVLSPCSSCCESRFPFPSRCITTSAALIIITCRARATVAIAAPLA